MFELGSLVEARIIGEIINRRKAKDGRYWCMLRYQVSPYDGFEYYLDLPEEALLPMPQEIL